MNAASDKLDRGIILSLVLHVGFFALVIASPVLFSFGSAANWGSANGGDGIKVNLVASSAAGLALPSPEVSTPDAAANDSKGFYQSQPAPPAPPPPANPKVEKIPDPSAKVKTAPPVKTPPPVAEPSNARSTLPAAKAPPAKAPAKPAPQVPDNAIPFGKGGRPDVGYGSFQTGKGSIGMGFGDGAFGTQFGPYVQGMQRRIQQNWLQGMIDPSITQAPKVYVTFDILRDGTISNFQIQQSSGIPAVDRSAQRAIMASSPLQPLPTGYSGSKVSVRFYFEYVR